MFKLWARRPSAPPNNPPAPHLLAEQAFISLRALQIKLFTLGESPDTLRALSHQTRHLIRQLDPMRQEKLAYLWEEVEAERVCRSIDALRERYIQHLQSKRVQDWDASLGDIEADVRQEFSSPKTAAYLRGCREELTQWLELVRRTPAGLP